MNDDAVVVVNRLDTYASETCPLGGNDADSKVVFVSKNVYVSHYENGFRGRFHDFKRILVKYGLFICFLVFAQPIEYGHKMCISLRSVPCISGREATRSAIRSRFATSQVGSDFVASAKAFIHVCIHHIVFMGNLLKMYWT
jgi:hypothetical protein